MPQMHDQDNSDWSKDSRIQSNLQSVSDAFFFFSLLLLS
jgi:hypothetical protein